MPDFDDIDEALKAVSSAFVDEARELLEEYERLLLEFENNSEVSDEAVNAVFRTIHSIKGSAGMFGFDGIVEFTHVVENVLSKIRTHELTLDSELIALLIECGDHSGERVELAAKGLATTPADVQAAGASLHERLNTYTNAQAQKPPIVSTNEQPIAAVQDGDQDGTISDPEQIDAWHISVRLSPEVFTSGVDPVELIKRLSTKGVVKNVKVVNNVPSPRDFNPIICYLGFELDFVGEVNNAEVQQILDVIRTSGDIRTLPPKSKLSQFVLLLNELPEDNQTIADLLILAGTIDSNDWRLLGRTASRESLSPSSATKSDEPVHAEETTKTTPVEQRDSQAATEAKVTAVAKESGSVRVDADKLDQLINIVSELVIAGAGADLIAKDIADEGLVESLSLVSRLVHEIRDSALGLRMVEIGSTFDRFKRIVRNASKELGKNIKLEVSGGETELDKFVVEQLADPLMHLVRNACDHGLEMTEARLKSGKPAEGVVGLHAYHDSGYVVIKVTDDGSGLPKEKILAKAIEKGVVAENSQLTDAEINSLIFAAGLSTAAAVTNISGRGVGMDVVKSKIESLRGSIDVESTPGCGAAFILRLPLTLAIIEGFLVRVQNDTYVIPLDMVSECIESPGIVENATDAPDYVNYHDGVLPYIRLRELFGKTGPPPERESIVVVRFAGRNAGLVVDELLGEYQTVIKPLNKLFENLRWTSGSTILGTGQVGLILDVKSLCQMAIDRESNGKTSKN